jgi:signal transduction histidine kinase
MLAALRDKRPAKDDPTIADRLRAHRMLAGAPQAELDWLIEHGTLGRYLPGDVVVVRGTPVDTLYFVLEGRLAAVAQVGGTQRKVMDWRGGDATGVYPYSRLTLSSTGSSVEEPSDVLCIDRADVSRMPMTCPHTTETLVHAMIDRARTFKANDLEGEKVASLGRVAAGLAHELNNPASAATRGARLLGDAIAETENAARALGAAAITESELEAIERVRTFCLGTPSGILSPLEQADREDAIAEWLSQHGIDDRGAAPLAGTAVTLATLDELAGILSGDALGAAVRLMVAGCHVRGLARDVERASSRVHELVSAVKRIAYMDRATTPEPVDLRQGLTDTSAILAHKARMKSASLTVDTPENLSAVRGFGGELNQVWMNLIDNALDAVGDGGCVTVSARAEGSSVVVRVTDDGPGIPEEHKRHIFDPFFTTKPVGQGTGMGLDIARRFVESNNGRLDFDSTPGKTEFRVALPMSENN